MSPAGAIAVRPATAADIDALVALLDQLFTLEQDFRPDPARQRAGLAALIADDARGLVACAVDEADRVVVGMATVQILISTAEGGPVGLVEDVVVDATRRGHGIGTLLMEAVDAWARRRSLRRLQLLADRSNAPALAFYRRRGWHDTALVARRRILADDRRSAGQA